MLRAIILGLVLVVALGTVVPIATEYAEAGAYKQKLRKAKKERRAKKFRRYITGQYVKSSKSSKSSKKSRKYKKTRRSQSAKRYRKSKRYRSSKRYTKPRRYKTSRKAKRTRSVKRYRKSRQIRRSYRKSSKRYTATRRTKKNRRVRKYSRNWMRTYRAKQSRQKSIAKRKRNMRLKRIRLAKQQDTPQNFISRNYQKVQPKAFVEPETPKPQMNYVQKVDENGDVSLEVVGPAVGETLMNGRNQTVGGVSTTTLRRTVIDKMIQENGWVENDFTKDVNGKKVYVVIAKSADRNNRVQSRTFYFTESNGQIYRVSAKAPENSSEQVVKKSEKVIQSLQKPEERPPQQAQNQ